MSEKVTRRSFITNTTLAAAAVSAAMSERAHASTKKASAADKIVVGIIGTGGRGCHLMRTAINKIPGAAVGAICDLYQPHLDNGIKYAGKQAEVFHEYREMLERKDIDAVVVTTPLDRHAKMSIDALQAGKHVFCEKTMAYSVEQAQDMARAVRDTGLVLQVGHQRHYDPSYIYALEFARKGILGRINHIRCQWHRNSSWRRHVPAEDPGGRIKDLERWLNWRLYKKTSGGLMAELGAHQVDIANWFLDAMPTAVTGMGGLDYWRDGREVWDNVQVVYEYQIDKESASFYVPHPRSELIKERNELDVPYTVRVIYSSITANSHDGASEEVMGDYGTLILREGRGVMFREGIAPSPKGTAAEITSGATHDLSNRPQEDEGEPVVEKPALKRSEQLEFESFFDCIRTGGRPDVDVMVGLKATICAVLANKSIEERKRIEIDPSLYTV